MGVITTNKIRFNKPPLTVDQQLKLLEERGLNVDDRDSATHYLKHLNYYRLAAYWLPFEADHETHEFKTNISFEQILDLYVFDRELRLLVMDAVERVEVSVRTQLAYHLSHRYGPHPHLDRKLFKNHGNYSRLYRSLENEVERSREDFIRHLRDKYSEPLPPIWAVVELMTLGQLSKWYANLTKRSDRKAVADIYGLDEKILRSFLHHLSTVRNICAHHGRLWNRKFTFQFSMPKKRPASVSKSINTHSPRNLYNTLVMLAWLMDQTSPGHSWKKRLTDLIDEHRINVQEMGFPEDYGNQTIWQPG